MEVGDARFVSAARSMTSNPHWMQRAELVLAGEDVDEQVARVSVWDKRASTRKSGEKMTCLGAAVFPLARLESFRPTKLDLALEGGVRDGARVALVLELRDARRETRREEEKTKRAEAARARRAAATTPSPARREAEATTFGAVLRPRGTPFAASPRTARDVPPRAVHSESRVEEKPEERVFEETRFAASRSAADHPRDAPLPSPLPSPRGETEAEKPVRVRESVTSETSRFETPSQPAGPRGGGDLSVSSGDDSNRAPRGDARARADSPPPPSPSPAHRRHHRLAPEVSFFAMTTPPASRAASANSRLKARARASTTPEAIPSEKRGPSSSRTSRVGESVDAVGDETPATSFVSRETTREHEGRGAEGEDASPPVPETTRRLESPSAASAPSAARRVAEAETQTDSERERAETHHCATADPTLRVRANDANDSEDVARTPPLPVRRLAVGSPVGSPVSIAGLAVRTRASASATEKEDALVDKRADREDAVASPPARPATPVPPLGHASPFGSFRPVDRTRGGSPARPPLRPRARGVSEREGKAEREGARPKPLKSVRRPGGRRSDLLVVDSSGKENDVFAAAVDVRNLSQEKETVSKKTVRVPETNKTFAFLNRAIPPDDALVAAATTRAVVAVELDEVRRLGRRLARAEAALDAF